MYYLADYVAPHEQDKYTKCYLKKGVEGRVDWIPSCLAKHRNMVQLSIRGIEGVWTVDTIYNKHKTERELFPVSTAMEKYRELHTHVDKQLIKAEKAIGEYCEKMLKSLSIPKDLLDK